MTAITSRRRPDSVADPYPSLEDREQNMAEEVVSYFARWNLGNHNGHIQLNLRSGGSTSFGEVLLTNPVEFQIVLDLLRNERPVFVDDATQSLQTGSELVGEGERR